MELRHLRYFIRAAELLNFTKAAESLYVSQPTLSVQIHQLEEELGAPLFTRVGRSVRLTEAGKTFLIRARQAVAELEEGGKEIDALTGLVRGHLCVGSLPLLLSKLISGCASTFNERYPNVMVRLQSGASEDIEAGIIDGRIDLGFVAYPIDHNELTWQELFVDDIVVLASKRHKIASRKSLSPKDLQDIPVALPSDRISSSHAFGPYFEGLGIEPRVVMTCDDGNALLELVRGEKLITMLPGWAAFHESDIVVLPLPDPGIKINAGAIWSHLSPASKAFLDVVIAEVQKLQAARV